MTLRDTEIYNAGTFPARVSSWTDMYFICPLRAMNGVNMFVIAAFSTIKVLKFHLKNSFSCLHVSITSTPQAPSTHV